MRLASWHFYIPFSPAAPVPDGYPVSRKPSQLVAANGSLYPGNDGVHIIFHQETVEANPFPGLEAVANVVSKRSVPNSVQDYPLSDFTVPFTVAEVVVSQEFKSEEEQSGVSNDDDYNNIHEAFIYAISRLNDTLDALALIQDAVLPRVTLESLPAVLIAAAGALEPWELSNGTLPKVRPQIAQLTNFNFHTLATPPPVENLDQLLGSALAAVTEKAPFTAYADLRREATHYHRIAGSYRVAIILYASACELFFDELLQHLLWEGGMTPKAASIKFSQNGRSPKQGRRFRNESIVNLVKDRLAPLLVDHTLEDLPFEFQNWIDNIAEVRNNVIHNNYLPTANDMDACAEAFSQIDSYIAEMVYERRRDYPITALALLGQSGLENRESWSPEFSQRETTLNEIYERARIFARWSRHLSALRKDYGDFEATISTKEASSLLVFHPETGKESVFAVHPNGTLATELPYQLAVKSAHYAKLKGAAHTKFSVFSPTLGDLSIPQGARWDQLVYAIPGTPACLFSQLKEMRRW